MTCHSQEQQHQGGGYRSRSLHTHSSSHLRNAPSLVDAKPALEMSKCATVGIPPVISVSAPHHSAVAVRSKHSTKISRGDTDGDARDVSSLASVQSVPSTARGHRRGLAKAKEATATGKKHGAARLATASVEQCCNNPYCFRRCTRHDNTSGRDVKSKVRNECACVHF